MKKDLYLRYAPDDATFDFPVSELLTDAYSASDEDYGDSLCFGYDGNAVLVYNHSSDGLYEVAQASPNKSLLDVIQEDEGFDVDGLSPMGFTDDGNIFNYVRECHLQDLDLNSSGELTRQIDYDLLQAVDLYNSTLQITLKNTPYVSHCYSYDPFQKQLKYYKIVLDEVGDSNNSELVVRDISPITIIKSSVYYDERINDLIKIPGFNNVKNCEQIVFLNGSFDELYLKSKAEVDTYNESYAGRSNKNSLKENKTMKLTKSEFKNLIKECLREELSRYSKSNERIREFYETGFNTWDDVINSISSMIDQMIKDGTIEDLRVSYSYNDGSADGFIEFSDDVNSFALKQNDEITYVFNDYSEMKDEVIAILNDSKDSYDCSCIKDEINNRIFCDSCSDDTDADFSMTLYTF